jgi:hypothetical protein
MRAANTKLLDHLIETRRWASILFPAPQVVMGGRLSDRASSDRGWVVMLIESPRGLRAGPVRRSRHGSAVSGAQWVERPVRGGCEDSLLVRACGDPMVESGSEMRRSRHG